MTKQEQINRLQFRIERIESHLAEQQKGNNFNLSEIPNSCEPDHYIPQPGEVVEVATARKVFVTRIFTRYDPSSDSPFMTVVNDLTDTASNNYRKGLYYGETDWRYCRRLSGEIIMFGCGKYTHLLPTSYEFCTEEQAEKWVKVECPKDGREHAALGKIFVSMDLIGDSFKSTYRPIRPIQYHVAVHEAVTVEPNPYAVDWSNAPEWADVHCFDYYGKGNWGGFKKYGNDLYLEGLKSNFTLPTGLDWKLSKTVRPK